MPRSLRVSGGRAASCAVFSNDDWPSGSKRRRHRDPLPLRRHQKAQDFPVALACAAVGVSTPPYYAWRHNTAVHHHNVTRRNRPCWLRSASIHSDGTYCSPRITRQLVRNGPRGTHKRVEHSCARLTSSDTHRGGGAATEQDAAVPTAPDLVGQLFDPDHQISPGAGYHLHPDRRGLAVSGHPRLACRRLLDWPMNDHMCADPVIDAPQAAVATRGRSRMDETAFHSNRGSQYTPNYLARTCDKLGVRRSMGHAGSCLDNAVAESFSRS